MSWYEYIIIFITSAITLLTMLISFNKIIDSKFKFNMKSLIIIIIGGIIITYNIYNLNTLTKVLINFLTLILSAIFTSKENVSKIIVNISFCYFLLALCEIITSVVVLKTNTIDITAFDNNAILKSIISFIDLLMVYYLCTRKSILKISHIITDKLNNNKIIMTSIFICIIGLILSDFKYSQTFSGKIFISNLIVIICLVVLLVLVILNNYQVQKEIDRSEVLLNFMKKYEKIIDENRISRHELLNNLLYLKSIKNKNSKEFDESLNKLIDSNNTNIKMKNIYKLPTGLKGIFYYKLYNLEDKLKININISKHINSSIEKIPKDDYSVLYKIVSIVLDNAIDASLISKDKVLFVDFYKIDSDLIIEINNSFKGKIDLNKINEKDYSSKGKGRGLGLYILKNLLKKNDNIELVQSIDKNIFYTKIIVKQKSES